MNPAIIILGLFVLGEPFPQPDKYAYARNYMVRTQIADRGITNKSLLEAMRKVPRHLFIPPEYVKDAYGDFPLPIGYGQTISQPYIVAYMTEAAHPDKNKRVLEIGTGSGYQAAVLAELVDSVYTIEIVPELAKKSAGRLKILGYTNIVCKTGNGYEGWSAHAPYDIIIVTAAPEVIPASLIDQLAENGRMIIPVGSQSDGQILRLVTRTNGVIRMTDLLPVKFVPFRRK